MGTIFVSYRRHDPYALAVAGLVARLAQRFGPDRVFVDTGLTPGERYPDELKAALAASDVVVAVIHDGWVADFAVERRMDWVAYELSTALSTGKTVIPVLLGQARQPEYHQVPPEIAEVTLRQSILLRQADYEAGLARLTASIEKTPAAPEVAVAVADPAGDQPARPRLVLALQATGWGAVFTLFPLLLAFELDWPVWQKLLTTAYVLTLVTAALAVCVVLVAVLRPWLDAVTRRWQEQALRASLKDMWPLYALYLLVVAVVWMGLPLLDAAWLGTEMKVLVSGAVAIAFARLVQRQVSQVSRVDTQWPPPVSPDPLTFRRAAVRSRELLAEGHLAARDFARHRQAESVYLALSEVRAELRERAARRWRRWLAMGHRRDPFPPALVGTLGAVVGLTVAGLAVRLSLGDTPPRVVAIGMALIGAALVAAAVGLAVSFRAERRGVLRLVDELGEWEDVLRPLVYPHGPVNPPERQP
ncbi:toll/interleukin-1 receptor domain-containing protein [Actinokineospora iranica]|uniref:Biopolymer transport protein ExbB/TolQ n=1 Tax=Actinokineospora iranica TaxID=1271860 RepID=A0A1G6S747_9PSEU|nr:toll/interleukin-1 receptor domain-containing protein [Actinokineospora iranica]SDD11947.1 Biopolymer transport protein ExbB/TolQ [Actinokineospora iranica]